MRAGNNTLTRVELLISEHTHKTLEGECAGGMDRGVNIICYYISVQVEGEGVGVFSFRTAFPYGLARQ